MNDRYDFLNVKNTLFVVTGMSGAGKSTLAKSFSEHTGINYVSVDDFKTRIYEEHGFRNVGERKILNERAKQEFREYVVNCASQGVSLIVDYVFDMSWQAFFDDIRNVYKYDVIIVYCNTVPFDTVWARRMERDMDKNKRNMCLKASVWLEGGNIYEIDPDAYSEESKERHRIDYMEGRWTSIHGDCSYTDEELWRFLNNDMAENGIHQN